MVQRALVHPVELLNCGGKRAVLLVRDAVDRNDTLASVKCIFLVDRDFGDEADARVDTYVTDGYAVETYYFGREFARNVIHDVFFNGEVAGDKRATLDTVVETYEKMEAAYLASAQSFNQWAYALRRRRGPGVKLDPVDTMGCIVLDLAAQTACFAYTTEELNALIEPAPAVEGDELASAEEWIGQANPRMDYRGKQHLIFMLAFLENCALRCRKGEMPFEEKLKVAQRFSPKTVLRDLSAFATTPHSLLDFLNRYHDEKLAA